MQEAPPTDQPEHDGSVRVANEVIASIAAMAAMEVDGVSGMDETAARHFSDRLKRQSVHRGVRVSIDSSRAIHLEVFLQVRGDSAVPPMAAQVQANVVESVERMLNLEVAAVDVFVSSVAFPAPV